jgi:hypothetical protein
MVAASVGESSYQAGSDRSLEGVLALVRKGVKLGISADHGLVEILAVERSFARCRPDLVGRDSQGKICVLDWKVKMQLDPKYYSGECRKYNTETQFLHYSMAVGEYYGEHVETVIAAILVLAPHGKALLHPVKVSPERLAYWRRGAEKTWQEMQRVDSGEPPVPNFTACETKFGPCDFYQVCHNFDGDTSYMEGFYDAV